MEQINCQAAREVSATYSRPGRVCGPCDGPARDHTRREVFESSCMTGGRVDLLAVYLQRIIGRWMGPPCNMEFRYGDGCELQYLIITETRSIRAILKLSAHAVNYHKLLVVFSMVNTMVKPYLNGRWPVRPASYIIGHPSAWFGDRTVPEADHVICFDEFVYLQRIHNKKNTSVYNNAPCRHNEIMWMTTIREIWNGCEKSALTGGGIFSDTESFRDKSAYERRTICSYTDNERNNFS